MPLNNIEQEVIATLRKEFYPKGIKPLTMNVSPDWLESFLSIALSKAYEEGKRESVEKVRNCVEDHIKTWGTSYEPYEPMVDLGEKIIKLLKNK